MARKKRKQHKPQQAPSIAHLKEQEARIEYGEEVHAGSYGERQVTTTKPWVRMRTEAFIEALNDGYQEGYRDCVAWANGRIEQLRKENERHEFALRKAEKELDMNRPLVLALLKLLQREGSI